MSQNDLADILEVADQVDAASTSAEVLKLVRAVAARFGFSACLLTRLSRQPDGNWRAHLLLNAWPDAWYEHYMAEEHYRHDPCVMRCRMTADPFLWRDVRDTADHSGAQARVMNEASDFGLRDGFCIPMHTPTDSPAVLTFSGSTVDLSPSTRHALNALAWSAYRAVAKMDSDGQSEGSQCLSGREREILQWIAAGKTAWEVSRILSIAESTVNTHIRNAKQKLETTNVVQAVVESIRRHEIRL